MRLTEIVKVFVVFLLVSDAFAWFCCRRRRRYAPPTCSWRTCQNDWKDDWSPSLQPESCVNQKREAHHTYTSYTGTRTCPTPTPCSPQTQSRTMCKWSTVQELRFYAEHMQPIEGYWITYNVVNVESYSRNLSRELWSSQKCSPFVLLFSTIRLIVKLHYHE